MAHIAVSARTVEMVQSAIPYGNQSAFRQFVEEAKSAAYNQVHGKRVGKAQDAWVVEARILAEAEISSKPIVPVFRRPVQKRSKLFGSSKAKLAA